MVSQQYSVPELYLNQAYCISIHEITCIESHFEQNLSLILCAQSIVDLFNKMAVEPVLLSVLHKMYVVWLPLHATNNLCETTFDFRNSLRKDQQGIHFLQPCGNTVWWSTNATTIAQEYFAIASTSQSLAVGLLGFVGLYSTQLQTCPTTEDLSFTDQEYSYLWNVTQTGPFCKVRTTDGQISYSSIARVKSLVSSPIGVGAINAITQAFRANLQWINVTSLQTACQSALNYGDMSDILLSELCGCYIQIPTTGGQFTTEEQQFLIQNPQCMPSCLDAAVRFTRGGPAPIPCQQDVCIINDLNVSNITTSITQVCTQCSKQAQCVCYIHLNGRTLQDTACNTVYQVDNKGNITNTTYNSNSTFGSGILSALKSIIHSKITILAIVICLAILLIVIAGVLISHAVHGRTKKRGRPRSSSTPVS